MKFPEGGEWFLREVFGGGIEKFARTTKFQKRRAGLK
jgi:hypothetical protein